jgi:hypothetical protein
MGIVPAFERKVNGSFSAAKRVARNPGTVCKHILAAWGLAGQWDLLAVCEDLPDGLKEEARHAYIVERKRLLQA